MNALNTLVRPGRSDDGEVREVREEPVAATAGTGPATGSDETAGATGSGTPAPPFAREAVLARVHDADGMAVGSFVMGLAGLLVFNLILGPCALVLGGLALMRGTTRRGRAALGITLGAADLIVLAAVTAADQSVSWSIAG